LAVFRSPTTFGVVAALVSAGGYPAPAAAAAGSDALPQQAATDIRRAQVQLYCGHSAEAVAGIRSACGYLHPPRHALHAAALAQLDRAAWLARRERVTEAEDALQAALALLQVAPGPA
jgi:hypothetical protein